MLRQPQVAATTPSLQKPCNEAAAEQGPRFPTLAFVSRADGIRKFLIGAITTSSPRAVKLLGVSLALFAGGLAGVQSAAWIFRSICIGLWPSSGMKIL